MKNTQNEMIIKHLSTDKLRSVEALNKYGIYRLAARISELRKQGYGIKTEMVTIKNRFNVDINIAEYSL